MAERAGRNQCAKCQRATLPGRTRCAEHATDNRDPEAKNRANRARYWTRKRAGKCTDCGAPAPGGASRCEPCAERSLDGKLHRLARDGYDPGAGFARHDGREAFDMPETWEAFAE